MKFTVVIPTCDRPEELSKCVEALGPGKQSLSFQDYEVIVSDDGKDKNVKENLSKKFDYIRWIPGPMRGPAANRNNGAKYAKGPWLVFADDDCIPDEKWLEAYWGAINRDPETKVYEGRIYSKKRQQYLDESAPLNESGGFLWSCNMAIERIFFKSINGFDERYLYASMEDVDLRERIIESGFEFNFVKEAAVEHPYRRINWYKSIKPYYKSLNLYLRIHKNKSKKHFGYLHFRRAIRGFVYDIIPFIFKLRFRGFFGKIYHLMALVYIGVILCWLDLSEKFKRQGINI